ncbi:hypothetical protein GD429_08940 [Burkholderia sp. BE17]|nr:hypothetical protein [Burkholderia sp. BE17]
MRAGSTGCSGRWPDRGNGGWPAQACRLPWKIRPSLLRFSASPLLRFSASPLLRFSASPLLRFSASPLLRFSASPLLRFSASPLLRFFASSLLRSDISTHSVRPCHVASVQPLHFPNWSARSGACRRTDIARLGSSTFIEDSPVRATFPEHSTRSHGATLLTNEVHP